jgi:hypothetical protein
MSLYADLLAYGDQIELTRTIDGPQYVEWTESNFVYVRYNPRKPIDRWGLSLTSLDGEMTGIPDLDSLFEYNKENGTSYSEREFHYPTMAYEYEPLKKLIYPWKDHIFRSHILKLSPGGFFPPHRDMRMANIDSFRLIVPLQHTSPPDVNFVLEEKILNWKQGTLYFVNTAKMHYLFNASLLPSYWLVFNVDCNSSSVESLFKNMAQR